MKISSKRIIMLSETPEHREAEKVKYYVSLVRYVQNSLFTLVQWTLLYV